MAKRKKQRDYHRFPLRIVSLLLREAPATIQFWRMHGIIKSYKAEDIAEFLHTYFIWRGVEADQPWHTLIAENIDPDDEGLPPPPPSGAASVFRSRAASAFRSRAASRSETASESASDTNEKWPRIGGPILGRYRYF